MQVKPRATVKKPGNEVELEDWQVEELRKCIDSPEYFIRNYVWIQHPTYGSVLFNLYDYQERVLDGITENNFSIILQPRQSGKSALIVAFFLWLTIFFADKRVGIAAHINAGAMELIERFQYAYEFLPMWMKPAVVDYNKHSVSFDNDSSIVSQATTEKTFRGLSMSAIYLDEFAFVNPRIAEAFWASLLPSLSAGNIDELKVIITSTPCTSEGKFAELWFRAERGDGLFNPIRVYNDEVPDRGEAFKQKMLGAMSPIAYAQEFDCCFLSDKGTLITSDILEAIKPSKVLIKKEDIDFYKDPSRLNLILGVDVAEGIGDQGDYSVIQIFEKETLEQVAEYRNNMLGLTDFAKKLISVMALLKRMDASEINYTIESNPIGLSIIELLRNASHTILEQVNFISQRKKRGILMTNKTKLEGCSKFKDLVESGEMLLHSRSLLSELKFFVKRGASFSAESGKNDDLTIGVILVVLALKEMARHDDDAYDKLNRVDNMDICGDEANEGDYLPVIF